ncbi:MAG: phosphatidate cytidylyltransferase [Spirochaetales bacterium]|nr:phosphatidate cytidylyltransferase [Spirochaetales bacterium]
MNKVVKRLLTFFIGVPLVLFIVWLDYLNHLALHIAFSVFTFFASIELWNMLSKKVKLFPKYLITVLTTLLPVISYIFVMTGKSIEITQWIVIFEFIFLMGIEAFVSKTFEFSVEKITRSLFILVYGGFLMTFLARIIELENSTYIFALFIIFVFMCDSAAWFFGILFGKNNRGLFAASPNKSIAGFTGGITTSILCGIFFKMLFPEIITAEYWKVIVLGLFTAVAAVIGDIIESVLKRSCEVKDSGNIIPGRGGVLDSIDSIIVAAPVFYIVYYFLF